MNPEQRAWLMAVINNQPSNPPAPPLTVEKRDELRALVGAGREEDAWAELRYLGNVAMGKAMALVNSWATEKRREHREVIEHESRMNADKKVPEVGAGGTAPVQAKIKNGTPASKSEIEEAFPLTNGWGDKLVKAAGGNKYEWLGDCTIYKGSRRPGDANTYNPLRVAVALVASKRKTYSECQTAIEKQFPTWKDAWNDQAELLKN